MPRAKNAVQLVTADTANEASLWALFADGTPEQMADWDFHSESVLGAIGECLQLGAAITFGAKRDLSGMSVRVYAGGAVVYQRYYDNVFQLNEEMGELHLKLRNARLKK